MSSLLRVNVFPNFLKLAKAVPIYKKGDPDNPGSYRPIAIFPVLGKILEVIMKGQQVDYVEKDLVLCTAWVKERTLDSHSACLPAGKNLRDVREQ